MVGTPDGGGRSKVTWIHLPHAAAALITNLILKHFLMCLSFIQPFSDVLMQIRHSECVIHHAEATFYTKAFLINVVGSWEQTCFQQGSVVRRHPPPPIIIMIVNMNKLCVAECCACVAPAKFKTNKKQEKVNVSKKSKAELSTIIR